MRQALDVVHTIPGLNRKRANRLESEMATRLGAYPIEAGTVGVDDFRRDLAGRHPLVATAIARAANSVAGASLAAADVRFDVVDLSQEGDFRLATNLQQLAMVDQATEHKVVERGMLELAGLNQRIQQMRTLNAVTGFQENELPLFEAKLGFLAQQLDPDAQERHFDRVVSIGGLPSLVDLPADAQVNVERVLELRESAECRELRTWLRSAADEADEATAASFHSVREKAAAITHTKTATALRFLATQAVGLIPIAGPAAGAMASLGDAFVVDHLLGKPGPISFLGREYRSIFRE